MRISPWRPRVALSLSVAAVLSGGCIIIDDLPADFAAPDCAAGQLVVEGAFDKVMMPAGPQPVMDFTFTPPAADAEVGSLEIRLANGDRVALGWAEPLAEGPVQARGVADFTMTNGAVYGNCDNGKYPGGLIVEPGGARVEFHLDGVRKNASCEERTEQGDIVGCFAPATPIADF